MKIVRLIDANALKEELNDYLEDSEISISDVLALLDEAPTVEPEKLEEPEKGRFECRIKIKDLISMLLEFDMNEKATIYTTDEYKENNIVISITDMRGEKK